MLRARHARIAALALASLILVSGLCALGERARAQGTPPPWSQLSPAEEEAFLMVEQNQMIRARELGEALVADDPTSFIGHLVLAYAQHFAEANFPRALYHANLARQHFEARFGPEPQTPAPWIWHARIIQELANVHGDLGHHAERIALIERFNRSYQPRMVAEVAWSLMKLGRYDEARAAARAGLAEDGPGQVMVALNALCAIEFEAGRDGASYDACGQALAHSRQTGSVTVVDLTNFAEAARTMFQLAEAERALLEATEASSSLYGNPWLDLAELYTRAGRFAEAGQALSEIAAWRGKRPPHARDADRNESRRGIAEFMLVTGMHEQALGLTDKAMVTPDRRAHNSRNPAQDRSLTALLDRRARRMAAESRVEGATAKPWYERLLAQGEAWVLEAQAFLSGRAVTRILTEDDALLVGLLRFGTASSGVQPPWLTGDLVELFGPGVMHEAIVRADEGDGRAAADPYYAALHAEVALAEGDEEAVQRYAARALAGLGTGEALLRARVMALQAQAGLDVNYDAVLGTDPGVFRRLEASIPVRLRVQGDAVAQEVADAVRRSPRFHVTSDAPLTVSVDVRAAGGRVCLLGGAERVFGCGEASVTNDADSVQTLAQRLVDAFHTDVFAPRVDMSQAEINSLDGSSQSTRNPLETLFGPAPEITLP
jgi:tetratricopeptide (TPR) repeat protein